MEGECYALNAALDEEYCREFVEKAAAESRIVLFYGEGAVKRRIMDMGITKGTDVYIRKVAPLGDPIEVTVRGYELSLRKLTPT